MSDNEARARELARNLNLSHELDEMEIVAALSAAEARGHIAGLKEALELSPIYEDATTFTVQNERERLHAAIDARLAALTSTERMGT